MICHLSKHALRQAKSPPVTVIPAFVTLARVPFERLIAITYACVTIAYAPIGTFHPQVCIVICYHGLMPPSMPFRTSSKGAVGSCIIGISRQTNPAVAVIALVTFPMTMARMLAFSYGAIAAFVEYHLMGISQNERGSTGR
jgi:hypothetical protein